MNEGDNARLEDFFLKIMLENSKKLEGLIGNELNDFWKIEQESDEILMATGKTKGDDEGQVNIYVNIGQGDDKRFVARIQDLIARAREGEDNYILCLARKFDNTEIEEIMQDIIFFREKNIYLIFLTVNFEEREEMNFKDIIKEEVGIKVYRKKY